MEFPRNPNTKCTEKKSSISMHTFSNVTSFSKISKPQIRTNKLVNSVFYHPCPSRLASGMHPFHISLNSSGFYLSRMLVEFSLTYIFQNAWEKVFNLQCSHFQKIIKSMLFYSCPSLPTQKSWQNFLKICFPQDRRCGRKLWFAPSKSKQNI